MSIDSEDIENAGGGIRNLSEVNVISQEPSELVCGMKRRALHNTPLPLAFFPLCLWGLFLVLSMECW